VGRTHLVKLSDEEYELLQKAKRALIQNGTNGLPPKVRKEVNEKNPLADLALGAIVGAGAVILLAALLASSDSKKR
jgi:hypothetical protein